MGTLSRFHLLATVNSAAMSTGVQISLGDPVAFDICPEEDKGQFLTQNTLWIATRYMFHFWYLDPSGSLAKSDISPLKAPT